MIAFEVPKGSARPAHIGTLPPWLRGWTAARVRRFPRRGSAVRWSGSEAEAPLQLPGAVSQPKVKR
jgi:hypothetical protein